MAQLAAREVSRGVPREEARAAGGGAPRGEAEQAEPTFWRKRMGIEPTHPGKTGTPTDLKSARATRPRALPPGLSRKAVFEAHASRVLSCAPSVVGL